MKINLPSLSTLLLLVSFTACKKNLDAVTTGNSEPLEVEMSTTTSATSTTTDTIAVNIKGNSTGFVKDSATSHWNNRIASLAGIVTIGNLKWKSDYSASSIYASFQHGSGFTNTHTDSCANQMAPNIVLQYGSLAAGTTNTSIGDATYGGRNINLFGLDSGCTYDFILLSSRTATNAVMTITSQGKSASVNVSNNCSGNAIISGLVPSSGKITINLHGATAISNTMLNGFYLVKHGTTTTSTSGTTSSTVSLLSRTADNFVPSYYDGFKWGTNLGYYANGWSDEAIAGLVSSAKGNTLRTTLAESFVQTYGYNIRLNAFKTYNASLNLKNLVCFIEGPSAAHLEGVTYPNSSAPSKLFKNMYTPIWNADSTVNPNNYFAIYVYNLVKTYGPYIRFWEVINEPDYTGAIPSNWLNRAPYPSELPNLQAPVYNYIRLLRIAYEVIKKYNHNSYVCPGGIGYSPFLDCLLRYSDNPTDGTVTSAYPRTGGAYFDVVSFHLYPFYSLKAWNNTKGGFDYFYTSDYAKDKITDYKKDFETVLSKYGYNGSTKPKKYFIITEMNVGRRSTSSYYGAEDFQRNFVIKALINAQKNNLLSVNIFSTGDKMDEPAAGTTVANGYNLMGLYLNLTKYTPGTELLSVEGKAWKTYGSLLTNAVYDPGKTAAMNIPSNMDGAAFKTGTGYTYALWAKATVNQSEAASATYSFPSGFGLSSVKRYEWDYSVSAKVTTQSSSNITLTGAPSFFQ